MALATAATITPLAGLDRRQLVMHGWKGWIPDLQNIPDRFMRPGASGGGAQSLGEEAFADCTAWRCESSDSAAIATCSLAEGLQNIVCKIIDPWGRNLKRVRIESISCAPAKGKGPIITGTTQATILILFRMRCERLPDDV
jgi:hypothetical protein